MIIHLPYPEKILSPNGRAHWGAKSRATAKHRRWANNATMEAVNGGLIEARAVYGAQTRIAIALALYPPDKRRRDADNAFSSCKAYLDGIADALALNDSVFVPTFTMMECDGNGRVEVVL